jgi:hypothetical protein
MRKMKEHRRLCEDVGGKRKSETNERDNMHEHIRLYSLNKPIKGHQEQFI